LGNAFEVGAQIFDQAAHGRSVVLKIGRTRVELGVQNRHGNSSKSSKQPTA
jgi:hypothetical protein